MTSPDYYEPDAAAGGIVDPRAPAAARRPAERVWVLTGSIGALTAATRLLGRLPAQHSLACLVALRVAPDTLPLVTGLLTRTTPFRVHAAGPERIPYPQDLLVMAINGEPVSAAGGAGGGQPPRSIDEVLAAIAEHYREHAGAIALSGIGSDGVHGFRVMQRCGGRVWVQAPESCEHASFPRAVLAACEVAVCAPPEQLAARLAALMPTDTPA